MHRSATIAGLALLAACGTTAPSDSYTIVLHEGATQVAFAGAAVPIDPAVRVFRNGQPVAGEAVRFEVADGGGALIGERQLSDAEGVARVTAWVLGAPGTQELIAYLERGDGGLIRIAATALHQAPALVVPVRGDNQVGNVRMPTAVRPAIRVTDALGNPAEGITVSWRVEGGTGGVRGADTRTDANGTASVAKWVLGDFPGEYALVATVEGVAVRFRAVALPDGEVPPVTPGT